MKFIDPSLEEVYETLLDNDKIIDFLKENCLLLTKDNLYGDHSAEEIENMKYSIYISNVNVLYDLAQVLLNHKDEIKSRNINDLLNSKTGWEEMALALNILPKDLTSDIYKNIMYTYKYCYASSFFQNNRDKFIPENDLFEIENNQAAEAFLDAMMKEFDKLDCVIGKCCEYLDYDKIPWDLITYLTQMLGFEKTSFNIQEEVKFRELAKNILDLYKMKGTGYSFELFFNFLGFNIKIREFYFDRRLYYLRTAGNLETSGINKAKSEYYLTTSNPTNNELVVSTTDELVLPSDISPQYSLKEFNELCSKYGPEAVLGYSPVYYTKIKKNGKETGEVMSHVYEEKVYKYFKTNLIYYDISLDKGNPTPKDYQTITKCLDFLTPSYITKNIKVDTNTGKTEEDLGFDGDGSKFPDAQGNYSGFEMLDGEDWSQEYKSRFAIEKNGTLKVIDPYGYIGEDTSLKEPKSERLDERYIDYNNSIRDKSGIPDKNFRLPIGYRLVNKSVNRFLTGTGKGEIYNDYKRLKFLLIPKINGETVPEGSSGATILPYYTVPPFVKEGTDYKKIPTVFKKEVKEISLVGNKPNEDGSHENTVKNQIKLAHLIKSVKVINNPIEDYIQNDESYNELIISKITNRDVIKIMEFNYRVASSKKTEEELIKECYNKNIRNNYHISNIKKDDLSNLTDYKVIENYKDHLDVYKNFIFGEYLLAIDKTNGKLIVYIYGNKKIPSLRKKLTSNNDIEYFYNKDDYLEYLKSTNYNLVPAYNGSIHEMGQVKDLPNSLQSNTMLDAYKNISKRLTEMFDYAQNNGGFRSIDYISKNVYNIRSENEFFKPVRRGVPNYICDKIYSSSDRNHRFDNIKTAEDHFNIYKDEKFCNSCFFINGNLDKIRSVAGASEELILPDLYTFEYKNREAGTIIYSTVDNKLYIITGKSNYDYEELKDFYGRLTFYHKDENGNYHLSKSGIIEENETGALYEEKYSIGLGDLSIGEIDLYDENWLGYDEQSDEEEFIFYNHPHLVKYIPGKCFTEDSIGNTLPVRINRPVKELTDNDFVEDINISNDKKENSIGQNIIEDLCEKTVEQFLDNEISQWDFIYKSVPKDLIINLSPVDYELLELVGSNYKPTEDISYVDGKEYYTKSTNGFLSIIERNIEILVNKEKSEDFDYDYYSNIHNFLNDYYKIILQNDWSLENFPQKILDDYPPEGLEYSEVKKAEIKKKFNIIILQMGILMNELYSNKIYYYSKEEIKGDRREDKWIDIMSGKRLGIWSYERISKECPKLTSLWINNPLLADPYNSIFFNPEQENELRQYFSKYNILDELDKFKAYYNDFSSQDKINILEESKKLKFTYKFNDYFSFEEKTNFISDIDNIIKSLLKTYKKENIEFLNLNENNLGNDSNSSNWFRKYNNEAYYYKDIGNKVNAIVLNNYLSSDNLNYIYIPFVFKYGINKFSKDYYGENKEIYSEFSELLSCFCNSLSSSDRNILEDYLKQIYYNNLVNLYREAFIQDDSPLKTNIKGKSPTLAIPKNFEKFNGKAGTFFMNKTLLSSYINNGGKKDKDVRMKFKDFGAYVNKDGNTILNFKVDPKDFYNCYGNLWNSYYFKNFSKDSEGLKKITNKLLTCIKPNFYFNDKAKDYYSTRALTKWQRFRKFLSREFYDIEMNFFDVNGKAINNANGDVIDANGSIISNKIFERIKEVFNGYIEIKAYSKEVLRDIHGELQEINDFLNSNNGIETLNILNEDVSNSLNDEKNFTNGFLSIRKLNPKFVDNWISFPESLKWIEVDENLLADEFCSVGDDRSFSATKRFSYTSADNVESYNLSNDENNIKEKPEYIGDINKEGADNKYNLISTDRIITKAKLKGDTQEVAIPYNKCDLVFDENGDPALKVPSYILHTSNVKKITIVYDDGTKLKLNKRRKAVK